MSPRESTNRSKHGRPERVGWAVMVAAIVAYAGLALYLSRGVTFTFDDLTWLVDSDGFRPGAILTPHYGHLIADTRILYSAMLATVGPSELLIRLSVIVATSASALLLYALLKRRLGPLAALAPAIVVLLLGATPEPLLPSFMSFPQATAFGLGALLALERKGRYADAIACLLLVLSTAALEVGLAFSVAVAVIILADSRRLRRCWVFLIPMILFAAWWAWARQFDQGIATGVNVLLIPAFAADAIAAATSALAGLGHSFSSPAGSPLAIDWGRSLAPALAIAICWQGYRRGISRELLGFFALALFLLSGFALGYGPLRTPDADRYAYPIAIAIVLLAAEAFRGMRVTRTVLLALLLATLFALPANIYQLRNNGAANRDNSQRVYAEQVALDLARDQVSPDFNGDLGLPDVTRAADYYALVGEYGPITITPEELEKKPEWVREVTDAILLRILEPKLEPVATRPSAGCTAVPSADGQATFALPPGGARLRAEAPGTVSIRRFADAPADLDGALPAKGFAALELPADGYGTPWTATVQTRGGTVVVCPLAPGGEGS